MNINELKWDHIYEKFYHLAEKWWYMWNLLLDKVVFITDIFLWDCSIPSNNKKIPEISYNESWNNERIYIASWSSYLIVKWSCKDWQNEYWQNYWRYQLKSLNEVLLDKDFIKSICKIIWNDTRNQDRMKNRRLWNLSWMKVSYFDESQDPKDFEKMIQDFTKELSIAILNDEDENYIDKYTWKTTLESFIIKVFDFIENGSQDSYCWYDFVSKTYKGKI